MPVIKSKAGEAKEPETTVKDVVLKHEGTQIILPVINGKPMTNKEAITWLTRKEAEDQSVTAVRHELWYSPLDGAVAFQRAIAHKYGWSETVPIPGFWGDSPPAMIGVPIGPEEKVQVPWGRLQIPGIEGFLQTALIPEPTPRFLLYAEVKKKYAADVKELVDLTEKFLREQSIYKGKAVKVSFAWQREGEQFSPTEHCPKFMSLGGVAEDDLIFGQGVQNSLDIGLFSPIEYAEACRRYKVPLKRGVLLYGPYGTGKTMTATVTALKASRNGFTFVYLDSVQDLKKGLQFAAQYAPAVLFAEDIDRVTGGERSLSLDEVLNTLDGVDTKGAEILTVFTTNNVEGINPALLRMGRLDTLVEVKEPDAEAAVRLVKLYGRGLLATDTDFSRVGGALQGHIPAFIREVVERAKIAAIARLKGGKIEGHVLEADLLNAAAAMEVHENMLKPKAGLVEKHPELLIRVPAGRSEHAGRLLEAFGVENGD